MQNFSFKKPTISHKYILKAKFSEGRDWVFLKKLMYDIYKCQNGILNLNVSFYIRNENRNLT